MSELFDTIDGIPYDVALVAIAIIFLALILPSHDQK